MSTSLSIENVLSDKNNYNLAIPFVQSQQINPYYKLSVSLINVDTSDDASQVFKVGSRKTGNNQFEDLYSLTKPFLQRLATEAGIQFAPDSGDVSKIDENTWKANAFGALRLPDGSVRTSSNFKVIDLVTEKEKYRLAYQDKAINGIVDFRSAKDASSKYKGQWIDTGEINDRGYPINKYVVAPEDREKYIECSLLDAMAQLRANAPQKATTGAILRVIRDLTGVKGTYTLQELKKPFAVARMAFSPDYNDPTVKQMMLQQCMQSVGNLFGSVPAVTQTISVPAVNDVEDEIDIPAFPEDSIPPETDTQPAQAGEVAQQNSPSGTTELTESDRSLDYYCDQCDCRIQENVWDYSVDRFDRPLCYKCQRIVKDGR